MSSFQHLDQQSIEILAKYFKFDKIFDLAKYDLRMSDLYVELSEMHKETYDPDYRFIFLHYEIEYYLNQSGVGVTILNLQRILESLNISNYFCLVLSQQDLSNALRICKQQETVDITSIDFCQYQNFYWTNQYFYYRKEITHHTNVDHITKKFICLNRHLRFHRRVLFALLKYHNLLDDSMTSFQGLVSNKHKNPNQDDTVSINWTNCHLLQVIPQTRVNDKWFLRDDLTKNSLSQVPLETVFKNFNEQKSDKSSKAGWYPISQETFQQSFLSVVVESVFHYPSPWLTEKTIWPILYKRPFIIASSCNSLKNLKSLGFKTFDKWWDESYDEISDPEQRLLAIVEIIKEIYNKPIDALKELCREMEDVLQYNFEFYQNHFIPLEQQKLEDFCHKNLMPRYD